MTREELEKLKQDYLAKYVSDGYRCCSTCGQVAEHEATQLALSRGFDAAVSALVPDYERRLGVAVEALKRTGFGLEQALTYLDCVGTTDAFMLVRRNDVLLSTKLVREALAALEGEK